MSQLKFFLNAAVVASSVLSTQAWAGLEEAKQACAQHAVRSRAWNHCINAHLLNGTVGYDSAEARRPVHEQREVTVQRARPATAFEPAVAPPPAQPADISAASPSEQQVAPVQQPSRRGSASRPARSGGSRQQPVSVEDARARARELAQGGSIIREIEAAKYLVSACREYQSNPQNRHAVRMIRQSYRVFSARRAPLAEYCSRVQQNAAAIESGCNTVMTSRALRDSSSREVLSESEYAGLLATMNNDSGRELTVGRARLFCRESGFNTISQYIELRSDSAPNDVQTDQTPRSGMQYKK